MVKSGQTVDQLLYIKFYLQKINKIISTIEKLAGLLPAIAMITTM